jgi:polyisoprenoid-binding protein YceI
MLISRRWVLFLSATPLTSTHTAIAQEREFDPLPGGGQVYTVDRAHSLMDFTVRLAGFNRVRGSFENWDADVFYDPAHPERSSVNFVAEVTSVNTANGERDRDLRAPAFFDVNRFPQMRFHSTRATPSATGFTVDGVLTIRDSSRTVSLPIVVLDPKAVDPFGNWRISFGTSLTLNRRDFGVVGPAFWNHAISDSVTIEMEIAARLWNYFRLGFFAPAGGRSIGALLYSAADSGRLADGLTRARGLLSKGPDSTLNAGYFQFEVAAMRRGQLGKLDDARQILQLGVETTSKPDQRSQLQARLGEVQLRMGRTGEAARTLQEALASNPDNTLAQQLLVRALSPVSP